MEGIRIIGTSICITLVITAIFSMLMPNTKLDKVVKFALSLFFLTSVIAPFANTKLNFNVDIDTSDIKAQQYSIVAKYDESLIRLTERNVETSLERLLMQSGIDTEKIQVVINKSDNNNISISKVLIQGGQNVDIIQLNRIVKGETGVTPTVVYPKSK